MPTWSPWKYSSAHQRFYSYLYGDDDVIMETIWADFQEVDRVGIAGNERSATETSSIDALRNISLENQVSVSSAYEASDQHHGFPSDMPPRSTSAFQDKQVPIIRAEDVGVSADFTKDFTKRSSEASERVYRPLLTSNIVGVTPSVNADTVAHAISSQDVQTITNSQSRFLRSPSEASQYENLDPSYRRVAAQSHSRFFVPGRVFAMLWTEPAGIAHPGSTRGSTHFSLNKFNETAYSEIRRFLVISNRKTFSQCVPIQTYRQQGAKKPGLIVHDHGIIHTSETPPPPLEGDDLTKQPIRVQPSSGYQPTPQLDPASRVNYGKSYAVEHNVKVRDIGMVVERQLHLIISYFRDAMMGTEATMGLEAKNKSKVKTGPDLSDWEEV
ncbi:hypothetical protein BDV96DRAFT_606914 [Lophiotrema nucula]|uniref:DUF6590 domain-containing protein n=1 Tax=Lophiotrema nucula TaxID=690887 RepID=A0A6A5YIG4_9PLEO|nr:hypothetical protein BDV96DRAFT_606914 [Lophiotrema nucula]